MRLENRDYCQISIFYKYLSLFGLIIQTVRVLVTHSCMHIMLVFPDSRILGRKTRKINKEMTDYLTRDNLLLVIKITVHQEICKCA